MSERAKVYLAVDLGASSGRVVAGLFDGHRLTLEDVYRFDNGGILANDRLHWDLLAQWNHIQQGLRAGAAKYGNRVASVGVDTWGVDFGLLARNDELLGNPYHYRDSRTVGHDGQGFFHREPRRDFCGDRSAVHGIEHAVPVAGDEAPEFAAAGDGRIRC